MTLDEYVVELLNRVQMLERRVAGMFRHGEISEVDPATQTARVKFSGDGEEEFLSPKLPYAQLAAPGTGYKAHIPPTVGQNVSVMSPTGDLAQGVIHPFTWSNDATSPGTDENPVETFGDVKRDMKADYDRSRVKDTRAVVREGDKTYAKFRCGDQFLVVTKDKIICSILPEVGEDPDPEL